jgi:inosose dehydratase
MTVGIFPNVPGPDELLNELAAADYEGTELGPSGYLGEGEELRTRIERNGLALTGAWCPLRFSEPEHWELDLADLARTISLFEDADARDARPVFGDAGSDARRANPGRGKDDSSLGLDEAGWRRFSEGLKRAENLVRERGFEPTFHAHAATFVEAPAEIDRLLELSDIGLLLDTGHLLVGGTDPVQALRNWGPRVNYVHLKDARLDIVRDVVADRIDKLEAWRRGLFCELGAGDVDLEGFIAALQESGYSGWIVVEQDRIPRDDEPLSESAAAQRRNRHWLRERCGL